MSFQSIIGHARSVTLLKTAIARNSLAHALLFTGLKGVGKSTLARAAAKSLLCLDNRDGEACNECDSCRRMDRDQHPDFMEVSARKKDIGIDQIREVRSAFRISPTIGANRVVLIRGASAMNPYASNALLKTLEEPSPGNYLFLTTEEERELLPTIISRCQLIRLAPLSEREITDQLVNLQGAPRDSAVPLARLSGGSYGRAMALAKGAGEDKPSLFNLRPQFIQKLHGAAKNDTVGALGLARELDALQEDVFEFLEMLKTWFYDLLLFQYNITSDRYANADLLELIERYGAEETVQSIFRKLEWIEKARRTLLRNGNRLLTLEVTMLQMRRTSAP